MQYQKQRLLVVSMMCSPLLFGCGKDELDGPGAAVGESIGSNNPAPVTSPSPASHSATQSAQVPAHVAKLLSQIPSHYRARYDPQSPAGLSWIRVQGPLIGDDRWLVREHSSIEGAETHVTGKRPRDGKREHADKLLAASNIQRADKDLELIPSSTKMPRRFRLRVGRITLDGDLKAKAFDELRLAVSADRFWPTKGLEIDGKGVGLKLEQLGAKKLEAVVLLRDYSGLLMRDAEQLIAQLPFVVGHAKDLGDAQAMQQQLEALGAKVSLEQN